MKNPVLEQVLTPVEYRKLMNETEIRNVHIFDLTIAELMELHGYLFAPDKADASETLLELLKRSETVPDYDLFTSKSKGERTIKNNS